MANPHGIAINASAFRMRPLTWTLLALLAMLLIVALGPNLFQAQSDFLQGAGVVFALIVLIIGMALIRHMSDRLARLAAVAEAIGQGNYKVRAEDGQDDAIGLLAQATNRMVEKIQSVIQQLEAQQSELQDNRAKLEEQNTLLGQEYRRQSAFGELLGAINTVDINTITEKGLAFIMSATDAQLGQAYIRDERAHKLLKLAERGIDRIALKSLTSSPPEQGLPGEVLLRKDIIRIETIDAQTFPLVNLGFAPLKLRSVLGLPILFQGQALGVIVIGALHLPDDNAMRGIQNTLDALGSALNNALTYKTVQQQALRLEQANQELREADRLRSEFVANMSHELRTPLNSIIGFSNILLKNRNQTLAEKDLDHAEKINRNGKHLLNLINDILDLSKIESGRMEVEVRPTRVDGLAREVVDMLKPQAEARNINLEFTSESTLHTLYTDTDKLKQVLINLIGNAIKFTHEGGVRVRVLQEDPQSLSIAVSDSGIGIPPQQLEAIFEPFRQVDSSTTRKYGGTGLGLTISRSIIHMLNGEITVKSELGKGSTFSVRLPLTADKATPISAAAQPPAAVAAQPPAVPAAPVPIETPPLIPKGKGPRRVLIVDDDADARELLSGYITEIGALPILAADGEQALRLAREHHPDLITLDLMMPGIDGWEVLKRLKVDAELQAIPVVIISIVAERRKAVVLGAIDAITKPIVHDDLIAILRRTLHAPPHGRVLVVDDNPEVLDLFRHLLADEVAEIRTAYNGKDALDVLRDYRPDLIFLDLMMPEMDGLTFLRVLRTDKQLMSLPVIIVTAKELTSSERKELEMRVVDIIQKGDESLEDRLREVLEKAMEHA